ncbi:MAG: acyl-CoA reductase, partial [Flavobacteriales bacterium]
LGCRNVGHLLAPADFDIQRVFANIVYWSDVVNNNKYGNNYDYYRALFLLNQEDFLENGFIIIRENEKLHTPVGILHVSRYQTEEEAAVKIAQWEEKLQCVVGHGHIPFGKAQQPELWDYADGVNTMAFLANL